MSEHVTEWLSTYLDGELRGAQLHQVEAHLAGCQACRAELEGLQALSSLLRETPAPGLTSAEKLAARVNLRLPRQAPRATKRRAQDAGWWLIPVGLLIAWILMGTTTLAHDVLTTADGLGLLRGVPTWLVDGSATAGFWSDRLGEFGMLGGSGLQWAEQAETFTRSIVLQASMSLLYVGWVAIWWVRNTRQRPGRHTES